MADNVEMDAGTGGATIAADDIGGVHYPRTKIVLGADGAADLDLDSGQQAMAASLPVAIASNQSSIPVAATCTNAGTFAVQAVCTNAGTFAVQVDGNALTALQLIDDVVYVDDADWTDNTSKHALVGGVYQSSPHTVTDGDVTPFLTDANGRMVVAAHAVTNAGTFATQVDGAALTALQLIDNPVFVDDAAFTATSSSVMMIGGQYQSSPNALDDGDAGSILLDSSHRVVLAPGSAEKTDDAAFTPGTTGVVCIGMQADETATDSVDEGDAGCPRITLDRKQIVTNYAHTTGGCSIFRSLDIDETEEDVKTAAGQVYAIYAFNTTNAILWLKFYNATAANVSVGSTTPVMTFGVPGNNDTDGAGFVLQVPTGIAFDTAICVAATTGVADADTGAPGANACIINVLYK